MDSFFDRLTGTIRSTGRDVSKRTKELTDITKLKADLNIRNSDIKILYTELGKKYYTAHKDDEDTEYEEIALINQKKVEIKAIKEQMLRLKKEKLCPKCGYVERESAVYCSACGAKMD